MARLGLLPGYFLVAVIGCNAVQLSAAQNIPLSDLDKLVNRAPPPMPDTPVYGHAQGKVKEISKKTITIVAARWTGADFSSCARSSHGRGSAWKRVEGDQASRYFFRG
jgi:hypothetical protein